MKGLSVAAERIAEQPVEKAAVRPVYEPGIQERPRYQQVMSFEVPLGEL